MHYMMPIIVLVVQIQELSLITSVGCHEAVSSDVSCEQEVKGYRVLTLILTKYTDKG